MVPAFAGLGAPHWDQYARGAIVGLTRGSNRAHIARAALEGIAYQVTDVLHAMERDAKIRLRELRVDGGACANNLLMQFQADKVASARFGSALLADRESDELWLMVWSIGQHCDLRIEPRLYPLDGGVEILYSDETNAVKGGFTLWTPASREVFDRKWICGAVERLRAAWYHNLS